MPIDESFLEREAAKRRVFSILVVALVANVVVLGILYATGFLHREPTISRIIIYTELVVFGGLYFYFRRKFKKEPRK